MYITSLHTYYNKENVSLEADCFFAHVKFFYIINLN